MLSHMGGFELEENYHNIWTKIRFEKINDFEIIIEKIISILKQFDHTNFLVSQEYDEVQHLLKTMKISSTFYMAKDVKKLLCTVNPKFKKAFQPKECIRTLRYIGETNNSFTFDLLYESVRFNGAVYEVKDNFHITQKIGSVYFERVS